jgi:dTDP-4-amino-4,6-dideoxygalactose transaminase
MTSDAPNWRVTLSDIDLSVEEEEAVLEVLRSRWLSLGPRTAEFEQAFAELTGARHAVAVSNGTAALHLALLGVDLRPGDEVILPSLTFVATANAVIYCGATPVFADIEGPDSLLLDPADVRAKITSRTKAVIPMHYGGYPCDMDAFGEIASDHGLRIVEDAAHAPGAIRSGRPIGSIGDATCFSFFANKNLVTGEGGMVTTEEDGVAASVRLNRSHGMTATSHDKHKGHAFTYDVVSSGFNYRLTEIQSALGLVQLRKLAQNNALRRNLVRAYHGRLRRCSHLSVPFLGREENSACHLMPVVLGEGIERDRVQSAMKRHGVQTSVHYPPVHRFSRFRADFQARVPRVDRLAGRLLTLPLHPRMTEADVTLVCDLLEASIEES